MSLPHRPSTDTPPRGRLLLGELYAVPEVEIAFDRVNPDWTPDYPEPTPITALHLPGRLSGHIAFRYFPPFQVPPLIALTGEYCDQ